MSNIHKLCFIFTLIVFGLARNPQNVPTLKTDLQEKIDRYQKDLDTLKEQVTKIQGQLAEAKGQSSFDFASVQEGVANERDILHTITGYLTLPFNISSTECYDISETQKESITAQLTSISAGISALEANAGLGDECKEYQKIREELTRQKTYIESIKVALLSKGCGERPHRTITVTGLTPSGLADIAQSEYQTNLKAENLCYGSLTQEQVKLLWFAFTVKNNITNCPLATPFYDGTKCIQCTGDKAFFDLSLRRCIGAKGVDKNKQCIDPSLNGLKVESDNDEKNKTETQTPAPEPKEIPATYKDIEVDPLTQDPIVKSVTISKNKKTVQNVVEPIEGKAIIEKEKKTINTVYEQVQPQVTDPDYQSIRKKLKTTVEEVAPIEVEPKITTTTVKRSKTTKKWSRRHRESAAISSSGSSGSSSESGSSSSSVRVGGTGLFDRIRSWWSSTPTPAAESK